MKLNYNLLVLALLCDLGCMQQTTKTVTQPSSVLTKPAQNIAKEVTTTTTTTKFTSQSNLLAPVIRIEITTVTPTYVSAPIEFFKSQKLFNCESCICKNSLNNINRDEKIKAGNLIDVSCGGKLIYLSTKKVPYNDVWGECCDLGLKPSSIENQEMLSCMSQIFFSKPLPTSGNIYWTSQIDAALNRNYISCISGKAVSDDIWWAGEPDNAANREACAAVKFDNKSARLQDLRCGEPLPVLCETKDETIVVTDEMKKIYKPQHISYYLENNIQHCKSAFCNNKDIQAIDTNFFKSASCNNKTFYVNMLKKVSYTSLWPICCSYGLVPVSFEFSSEMKCVNEKIREYHDNKKPPLYWFGTAMIDSNLEQKRISCVTGNAIKDELWLLGHDKKMGPCVAFQITQKREALTTSECSKKFNVLCQKGEEAKAKTEITEVEVELTKKGSKFYKQPQVRFYLESNLFQCKSAGCKDNNVKISDSKNDAFFDKLTCNEKTFYYHVKSKNTPIIDLWSTCCKYGLVPLTLETVEDKKCLVEKLRIISSNNQNDETKIPYTFGTGIIDWNLEQKYLSCVTNNNIKEDLWIENHKKTKGPCVVFHIEKNVGALSTIDCNRKINIMCQEPEQAKFVKSSTTTTEKNISSNLIPTTLAINSANVIPKKENIAQKNLTTPKSTITTLKPAISTQKPAVTSKFTTQKYSSFNFMTKQAILSTSKPTIKMG